MERIRYLKSVLNLRGTVRNYFFSGWFNFEIIGYFEFDHTKENRTELISKIRDYYEKHSLS